MLSQRFWVLKKSYFFLLLFRVMRVYSTHTKKKAFCISKMSSGPLAEGEVSRNSCILIASDEFLSIESDVLH